MLKKFTVLLILTSLPIIYTAFLSPVPQGAGQIFEKLFLQLKGAVNASELFVYTATFLTPILYVVYEGYTDVSGEELKRRIAEGVRGVYKGFGLVAFLSFLVMLSTAVAYGSLKNNPDTFKSSFLSYFLVEYSAWIYVFSLFCWYLTLLYEARTAGDFVETNRNSEDAVSNAFQSRIAGKG
ncbi:hypothetical protein [Hydrogenophaga pseudoflava]|uniref:hypothetical protein n=1 Tax=Hydrogenophaga pseudoflava TaxID=47421 RepID=UPI0012FBA781|nr:hypothetical protein [Hydrogenophaga pseudoflava]